jgi:hypothetical protein
VQSAHPRQDYPAFTPKATAPQLRFRLELDVRFRADDCFVVHNRAENVITDERACHAEINKYSVQLVATTNPPLLVGNVR